jgi:hypothetical protein
MSRSLKIAVPSVDSALVVGIVGAKATAVAAMAFGLIDLSSWGGGPPLGEASPRAAVGEVRAQLSACPTPAVFASDYQPAQLEVRAGRAPLRCRERARREHETGREDLPAGRQHVHRRGTLFLRLHQQGVPGLAKRQGRDRRRSVAELARWHREVRRVDGRRIIGPIAKKSGGLCRAALSGSAPRIEVGPWRLSV